MAQRGFSSFAQGLSKAGGGHTSSRHRQKTLVQDRLLDSNRPSRKVPVVERAGEVDVARDALREAGHSLVRPEEVVRRVIVDQEFELRVDRRALGLIEFLATLN